MRIAMDGVIVINKPAGLTSHDVVSKVKKRLGARKVGHLGTLDPMATGVLPLVINRATKHARFLQGDRKEYRAVMKLGEETDTYDREGRVVRASDASGITAGEAEEALMGFVGRIEQIPPMYSAVKQGGVPLYKLARKGVVVEREPKEVDIHSIRVTAVEIPLVTFTVACSRGTYLRTLCHDAGTKLGCGAHLAGLERTLSGRFTMRDAVSMDAPLEELRRALMPLEELVGAGGRAAERMVS